MRKYRVELSSSARREFKKFAKADAERLKPHILALEENPRPPGCVKLAGPGDLWRIRIGDFRVIYAIRDDILVVIVMKIAHRREVYR